MKSLPDFSEWLTSDRISAEEKAWAETQQYKRNVEQVLKMVDQLAIPRPTVLEMGCGSGWVPVGLGNSVSYLGIDKNPELLSLCVAKNHASDAKFHLCDIRHMTSEVLESLLGVPCVDIVCSFAVLKHFGLHEWKDIFSRMLSLGNHGVFQVQISDRGDIDDGAQYHHTWMGKETIFSCVSGSGHELISFDATWDSRVLHEWTIYTRRIQ
jgi:cyclopropane fatty-acyl-phospholipid synthase-like methyltransferase